MLQQAKARHKDDDDSSANALNKAEDAVVQAAMAVNADVDVENDKVRACVIVNNC